MKTYLLFFILTFFTSVFIFPQQKYYTFSELKGMEDQQGNTHLFYRMYNYQKGGGIIDDYYENSIYHLNIENQTDTLFLFDGGRIGNGVSSIVDVEFWNNNPAKYIYMLLGCSVDCDVFIRRFDEESPSYIEYGSGSNIEISKQNDSLIFASVNSSLLKSTNGGIVWDTLSLTFYNQLISVNPLNDSILFTQDFNSLYKSTDGGSNFSEVDTFQTDIKQFFYDKDENHIYRVVNYMGKNFLSVSNNKGNAFGWIQKYSSENKILINIDNSQSGNIYLTDGRYIYFSNDYGNSFSTFTELDRKIVGIYKKPNSNKLYAATKYDLYEITPDSIKTLKHLNVDPAVLKFYPLEIGNKWVYHEVISNYDYFITYTEKNWSKEVIGKTIKENGKEYFTYKFTNYSPYYYAENFERVDTSTGKIFRYINDTLNYPQREYEVIDLLSEVGDTVNSYFSGKKTVFRYEGDLMIWDSSSHYISFMELETLALYNYNLVFNFGIDSIGYGFDFGSSISNLKGAVINGVVYGDTNTIVGINDEKQLPTKFSLSQNYPNPFNPSTIIKYTIAPPNLPKGEALVQLKVYDILGNEIATLVNKQQSAGNYEVEFNANNLASGIYFYKLQAGTFHQTKKMILLR